MRFLFLSFLLFLLPLQADSTDEVLVAVQRAIEREQSFDAIEDLLSDLPVGDLKEISTNFEAAWSPLEKRYLEDYSTYLKGKFTGSAQSGKSQRVRELRKEFHEVREMPEDVMKSKVKEISMPALLELHTLLMPEAKDLLAAAPATLKTQHKLVHGFAKFRDLLQEYSVSVGAGDTSGELAAAEKGLVANYQDLDRKGLRIMENNDKIAAKANLPEGERAGIRELNEWRLLLGQNALVIDPKLCDAGRGHSTDMEEKGFFAHVSPVAGKEKFTDRARLAGTTGNGENIYMGSTKPEGANKGWFYSPGHHKNMFTPGFKRVGLGQHNRHWTQMFGR